MSDLELKCFLIDMRWRGYSQRCLLKMKKSKLVNEWKKTHNRIRKSHDEYCENLWRRINSN